MNIKDNLIIYDKNINSRKHEMYYGTDISENQLLIRYSDYFLKTSRGITVFDLETKKKIKEFSLSNNNLYFRVINENILELRKEKGLDGGIYYLGSDIKILPCKSDTFEVFLDDNGLHLFVDDKIYQLDNKYKATLMVDLSESIESLGLRDVSLTYLWDKREYLVLARSGVFGAYKTSIVMYQSVSLSNLGETRTLITTSMLRRYGIDGVGFPTVRVLPDGQIIVYFSGFWGHHLLRRNTIRHWKTIKYEEHK